MTQEKQRTLAGEVTVSGVGVHSGEAASLTLGHAPPDAGVRFRRMDIDGNPEIRADLEHVCGTELGTSLGIGDVTVRTVEHVMAALAGHGVDNASLDLFGPEPPIRDGSFGDYFDALTEVGIVEQDAPARVIEVKQTVSLLLDGGDSYVATPSPDFRISATIDFAHPAIGRQFGAFLVTAESFSEEIAAARTFGFKKDAQSLVARGLALGASLENTVVLDDNGVLNDGLRYPDEFLRHKVGDVVGDLALLGARIKGHVIVERPSHRGNVELARALASSATRSGHEPVVDVRKIMEYLPHRYPMLLVDRIIGFESGKRIVGIKNVTINEQFFQGHYPGHPIMPGVLIVEAMAQVGGLLLMDAVENPEDKVVYFMAMDNVKWRRPVTPGDQLVFELEMVQFKRSVCRMRGTGSVDGKVVAEGEFLARIVDR